MTTQMKLGRSSVCNVEIDGVDHKDYPDFCDAFFSYAEFEDGRELSDSELEELQINYPEVLQEMCAELFGQN